MPSRPSPSSSVQAARQRLADQLAEIRIQAGINGSELAEVVGWNKSKVSRIEHAVQSASADDIRAWCRACRADERLPDLLSQLRTAEGAYVEWRRLQSGGLKRLQESYVPLYERTQRFRSYQSQVIPGLLQTAEYASAVLKAFAAQTGARPDYEEAAAARVERQRILHTGKTFAFILEEATLRAGVAAREVMADQLDRLVEVLSLRSVSLGIIPARPDRALWPLEGFMIFDDTEVQMEPLTARVTITTPGDLGTYVRAFDTLARMAVFGDRAADLITTTASELRRAL